MNLMLWVLAQSVVETLASAVTLLLVALAATKELQVWNSVGSLSFEGLDFHESCVQ